MNKFVEEKRPYLFYMHAGSGNHGCEAIVRGLCQIADLPAVVLSNKSGEDIDYGLTDVCDIIPVNRVEDNFFVHAYFYAVKKFMGKGEPRMAYTYRRAGELSKYGCAVSIGGDNYCYEDTVYDLMAANSMFNSRGLKTALLGCSIEPELLKRPDVREDMGRYSLIAARESITYNALVENLGACGNEKSVSSEGNNTPVIRLIPDPAFTLKPEACELPPGFETNKTIGINVSPLILGYERPELPGITLNNYKRLIEAILDETDNTVALIPHVVWQGNDDREPLGRLYERYKDTGRVILVDDYPAAGLKYIISRCRLFIGARTHATIAAYSGCVPTLVVGYSVKSRGIATDLFGTDKDYVLPVQSLKSGGDLTDAYHWLEDNAIRQKQILEDIMPAYIEKAYHIFDEV